MKSLKDHMARYARHKSFDDFLASLRTTIGSAALVIKTGKAADRSPSQWANYLRGHAILLNVYSSQLEQSVEDYEKMQRLFGLTSAETIERMKTITTRMRESVAGYSQKGINAQVQVTVNPSLEHAHKAVIRWAAAKKLHPLAPAAAGSAAPGGPPAP